MVYLGESFRSITMPILRKLCVRFALGYPAWMMLFYSVGIIPVGLSSTI